MFQPFTTAPFRPMSDEPDPDLSGQRIRDALRDGMRAAYNTGFEAGLARGRREAWDEFHKRIQEAYEAAIPHGGAPEPERAAPAQDNEPPATATALDTAAPSSPDFSETGRATRGAVRKAVSAALSRGPVTIAEIESRTGFKFSSIRSQLYLLRGNGAVERDGDVWRLTGVGGRESDGGDPEADAAEEKRHPDVDAGPAEAEDGQPEGGPDDDAREGEGLMTRAVD